MCAHKQKRPPFLEAVYLLVPRAGIEPARLAARDFESRASTYSAISATQAEHYARFARFEQDSSRLILRSGRKIFVIPIADQHHFCAAGVP